MGNRLTGFGVIEKEMMQFYGALVGTSSPNLLHVDIEALRKDKQLT